MLRSVANPRGYKEEVQHDVCSVCTSMRRGGVSRQIDSMVMTDTVVSWMKAYTMKDRKDRPMMKLLYLSSVTVMTSCLAM